DTKDTKGLRSESANAKQAGGGHREHQATGRQNGADSGFDEERSGREDGGSEEQSKRQARRGRERNDDHLAPSDAARQMEGERRRESNGRENADRPTHHRRGQNGPC